MRWHTCRIILRTQNFAHMCAKIMATSVPTTNCFIKSCNSTVSITSTLNQSISFHSIPPTRASLYLYISGNLDDFDCENFVNEQHKSNTICSHHFAPSQLQYSLKDGGLSKQLKPHQIPTITNDSHNTTDAGTQTDKVSTELLGLMYIIFITLTLLSHHTYITYR